MTIAGSSRVLTKFSFDLAHRPNFWPGDPVSVKFKNIKTNILSMIHDDCFKNVISSVLTRSSFYLAQWPSFQSQVTKFQT